MKTCFFAVCIIILSACIAFAEDHPTDTQQGENNNNNDQSVRIQDIPQAKLQKQKIG